VLTVPYGTRDAYIAAGWTEDVFKGGVVEAPAPIVFADPEVKRILVENFDTNEDGEIDPDEAAAVTDIGTIFKDNTTITSFDELQYFTGLTSIGADAFYECTNLASATLPANITSIDYRAFCNTALTSVTIPEGVTSIGRSAFSSADLTSITIPDSVTSIGKSAFRGNFKLRTVDIGRGVISIGDNAFGDIVNITKVIIHDIAAWCRINFESLTANPAYVSKRIYTPNNTEITSLLIPAGVTSIGNYAFANCRSLTSVTIPNSVTSIGNYAFYSSGLTSITIPDSVTSIGDYAF